MDKMRITYTETRDKGNRVLRFEATTDHPRGFRWNIFPRGWGWDFETERPRPVVEASFYSGISKTPEVSFRGASPGDIHAQILRYLTEPRFGSPQKDILKKISVSGLGLLKNWVPEPPNNPPRLSNAIP